MLSNSRFYSFIYFLHIGLCFYFYLFTHSFIYLFLLLFWYSRLHFPTTTTHRPTHPRLPPSNLPPLALSMGPLYMFIDGPSSIFPHCSSPPPLWLLFIFNSNNLFQHHFYNPYFSHWFQNTFFLFLFLLDPFPQSISFFCAPLSILLQTWYSAVDY